MGVKISLRKRIALELFRSIRKDLVANHDLKVLFWECTLRCNLQCKHCGSDCRAISGTADMPAEDFLRAVDTLTSHLDPHKVLVTMTGGEALIRKDIERIGVELRKRGYQWGVVTNGMVLDKARMESLVRAGICAITLSLDGFEEQHNAIRQNPRSFQNAIRALREIISSGVRYDVVTCVTPDNFASLAAFKEFLISEGCKAWRIFTVFPVGRAADDQSLQLSPAQYRELMEFIAQTRKEGKITCSYACEGFLGGYEAEVRDNFFGCMAGIGIAGIRIDGAISGCTSIRANFDQGNIYKDNLWEVWNTRFERYRNRDWARKGRCATCSAWRYCNGNGMHLYDEHECLMHCNLEKLLSK
ncbi:MAG: TIGR04133 family radical SAM/SPASM protein [Alistipes sp.]|nr:TIGR04133 family radical SAM/SPASM protein [Alistipes sp.]